MTKKVKLILLLVVFVLSVIALMMLLNRGNETTDDAALDAHVTAVSAKVSGYVITMPLQDNQVVKRGDLLFQIDPIDYQLRVDAARALLTSSEASAANAKVNADRQKAIGKMAGTQKDIDNATASEVSAHAAVDSAQAQLAIAENDLLNTKIVAPSDGIVTMRSVERGMYVSPGQQQLLLISPARWVVANFREVQLRHIEAGQRADIRLDAYPDLKLSGHVVSIQAGTGARFSAFPPENATGNFVKITQRVPVKIEFDHDLPSTLTLGPGLSAEVTVHTMSNGNP